MNFKSLTATILFVCIFFSINQFAYSQNMLEQMKELHLQKTKGNITAQEFEEKKKAIIESHSPEAKKRAEEEAKKLAEKQKQEKVLQEQKKREAEALALREYENKFPLHSALKKNDKAKVLELLKQPDLQINAFDNEGKTPWDIAYSLENTSASFELCKLLKDVGAASSKEIQAFELEKKREKLVTLKVCAGVSYQIGGYQPFVGSKVALCKLSSKSSILGRVQGFFNIFEHPAQYQNNVMIWGDARDNLMYPCNENLIDSEYLVKTVTTDQSGSAVFEDIEPDDYLIVFGGPTRSRFGIWLEEISCKEKENSLILTEANAYYID